ncbi:MAG TPA: GNAT family N-acetyltransferase [Longilinea sp.]|nr:GNAT family N-acetyltransferase [Longilinea sp.]
MTLIRPMKPADFPAIQRLVIQLINAVESPPPRAITETQMENVLEYVSANPEIYLTLVAEDENQVVGLLSLVFYRVWFHPGGTALITELIVDEQFRGKGIGANLIEEAVKAARARGMDEIEVGTERENSGAQRFYRRCGFDDEYVLLSKEFE